MLYTKGRLEQNKTRLVRHLSNSKMTKSTNTSSQTATSINDMPLEILAKIFVLNSAFDLRSPRTHFRTAVATSQVCSLWRHISFAYPQIWARCVDFGLSDEWATEVISRSKEQRLDLVIPSVTETLNRHPQLINFTDSTDFYSILNAAPHCEWMCAQRHYLSKHLEARSLVFAHCDRLFLSFHTSLWHMYYQSVIKGYLPNMKTIAIMRCRTRTPDDLEVRHLLQAEELRVSSPWKVEILKLENCLLPLQVPVFGSVRELRVTGYHKNTVMKPEAWLSALQNMPELRVLDLNSAFFVDGVSSIPLKLSRRINIPLLSFFRVSGNVPDLLELLHNVAYPVDKCNTTIGIILTMDPMDRLDDLCKLLAERYIRCDGNLNQIHICSAPKSYEICFGPMGDGMPKLTVALFRPQKMIRDAEYNAWPDSGDPLVRLLHAFKDHCGTVGVLCLDRINLPGFPGYKIFHLFPNTWKIHVEELNPYSLQALSPLIIASRDGVDYNVAETARAADLPVHILPHLRSVTYSSRRIREKSWRITRPGLDMRRGI